MREIKSELVSAEKKRQLTVLQNIPHHQSLVKVNRYLLILVLALMTLVFVLGFLMFPEAEVLDKFNNNQAQQYSIENPALSAEINTLKSQFVGLISGSIESKLRSLEDSIRQGSINSSLGTIQDLRNDVRVLRSYSEPANKVVISNPQNKALLQEVSHLKTLVYLTLTSCGLMIAALAGFWIKNHRRLTHKKRALPERLR